MKNIKQALHTLIAVLALFALPSCQADGSSAVNAYIEANGDIWTYTDGSKHFAAVGRGFAKADLEAYGLTVEIPGVELDTEDSKAWFKGPKGERTQEIDAPWPRWMSSRVRPKDLDYFKAKYGITISFELPLVAEPIEAPATQV